MKTKNIFYIVALIFTMSVGQVMGQGWTTNWDGETTNPHKVMHVYVQGGEINGVDLQAGDAVGIFDGDDCVGYATVAGPVSASNPLLIVCSERTVYDDTEVTDGFTVGNSIAVKLYDASSGVYYSGDRLTVTSNQATFTSLGTVIISNLVPNTYFNVGWTSVYNPMNIIINSAELYTRTYTNYNNSGVFNDLAQGNYLDSGDEIAFYDNVGSEAVCVAHGIVEATMDGTVQLVVVASEDDPFSSNLDGFINEHEIDSVVVYDSRDGEDDVLFTGVGINVGGTTPYFESLGTAVIDLRMYEEVYDYDFSGPQEIDLEEGWNIISFHVDVANLNEKAMIDIFDNDEYDDAIVDGGDADGAFDIAMTEDTDGDGILDINEDVDGDGNLDVDEDVNGNGVLDPGEDLDGDGNLDVDEDHDGDGVLNLVPEDLNGNGLLDSQDSEDTDGVDFINDVEDDEYDGNMANAAPWEDYNPGVGPTAGSATLPDLIKAVDEYGNFIQYISSISQWMNNLGDMQNTEGYYVKIGDVAATLTTEDVDFVDLGSGYDIQLNQGWNIMGYPVCVEQASDNVFANLKTAGELVKVMDEAGNLIKYINGYGWLNTIGNLEPGEGYYVKVTTNTSVTMTFPYPDNAATPFVDESVEVNQAPNKSVTDTHFEKVWNVNNPFSPMNFVISTNALNGFDMNIGDELAVFDGENCVGVITFTDLDSELYTFVAAADDPTTEEIDGFVEGNAVDFRYWNSATQTESNPSLAYVEGTTNFVKLGTFVGDFLHSVPANVMNETKLTSYPNPFSNTTTIRFELATANDINLNVYDIYGKTVQTLAHGSYASGEHTISLDASNLSKGVYFVHLQINGTNQAYTVKLIVQ
jgi:hypothetical protein